MKRDDKKWIGEKISVSMASRCNIYCVYCQGPNRGVEVDRGRVLERLDGGGVEAVNLEGDGEPTMNRDFFEWIDLLKSRGVKHISLSTNAVSLEDMDFCRRVEGCVDYFTINIPAADEAMYRRVTRSVKFSKALRGIENLMALGAGRKTRFYHNICRINYKRAPAFADWVLEKFPGISFVNFTFVRNLGRVRDDSAVLPTYGEAAPFVKVALGRLKVKGKKAVIQNMPLCVLNAFEGFSYEFHRWRRGDKVLEEGVAAAADSSKCRRCRLADACAGARPDYLRVYGDGELVPSDRDPAGIAPEAF